MDMRIIEQAPEIGGKLVHGLISKSLPEVLVNFVAGIGSVRCPVRIDKIQILMELQGEVIEGLGRFHVSHSLDRR